MDIIYTKQIYTQEHYLKISDIEHYQSETGGKKKNTTTTLTKIQFSIHVSYNMRSC